MTQQTINNGESGLIVRNKINDNFTELYTGKDSVTVNTFADLPNPTTVAQQKYWVLNSSGIYLVNRRNKGAYYSDGVVWTWLGDNPSTADQIGNVPAGSIAAVNVQAAINELDGDKEAIGTSAAAIAAHVAAGDPHPQYALESNFAADARTQIETALIAGTNVTITPAGAGATRTLTVAATGGGNLAPIITAITATVNHILNTDTKSFTVHCFAAGGSGGSGARQPTTSIRSGGGGGSSGAYARVEGDAALLFTRTLVCTVGVGGVSVAGRTTDATVGLAGNAGSGSSVACNGQTIVSSRAGQGGSAGGTAATSGGGAALFPTYSAAGGQGRGSATAGDNGNQSTITGPGGGGGGSGQGASVTNGTNAGFGGPHCAMRLGSNTASVVNGSGNQGLTTGVRNGGAGVDQNIASGVFAGTIPMGGGGGGGGAYLTTAVGGNGGTGGFPGGGGGGGSASDNGQVSGASGAGGNGLVIIVEYR